MKIGFYGRLAERIGREIEVEPPGGDGSVAALRRQLADRFPGAAADLASPSVRACVDAAIVPDTHVVQPGQRVDFLPPLSGG